MKAEDIKIGQKVVYFPYEGTLEGARETLVRSLPWECCGNMICKVEGVTGGVNVTHLTLLDELVCGQKS